MKRTALLLDRRFLEHRTLPGHPERPERIEVLLGALETADEEGLVRIAPRPATREELLAAHAEEHLARVADTAGRELTEFDADTSAGPGSHETALHAAGGFLEVLDAILDGRAENGLALVRPPGHHAESNRVMGFCLYNNIAVGARHLRRRRGLRRVLIVDWDVHHGNGTQEIFWDDPGVLYVSLHEFPLYPGTGAADETGRGAGSGATLNVPLPSGSGDDDVLLAFDRIVEPACRNFDPEFVLISAGFDAHARDPLASLEMSAEGFARLTRRLLRIAENHCDGRCAAVLEGGYDLEALRSSVLAVLRELRTDRVEGIER
jgi:acetoin utilization deacetylase AcuC-like enzyme